VIVTGVRQRNQVQLPFLTYGLTLAAPFVAVPGLDGDPGWAKLPEAAGLRFTTTPQAVIVRASSVRLFRDSPRVALRIES